jgi:anti-sigma regulatory factor (Ser/Thr protein kinase)
VRELRHTVARFAAESCANAAEIHDDLVLTVTEAATNAIIHAYPDGGGDVTLNAWTTADSLLVEVHDDGVGIDCPSTEHGLGHGLHLIRALAEPQITGPPGTTVRLRFPRVPI